MQLPVKARLLAPLPPNLLHEQRPKAVAPKADRFMAYVDTRFVKQVLNITKRKWEPNIHHHCQKNDLRTGFKVTKCRVFCH
jgi:hypothetical protein